MSWQVTAVFGLTVLAISLQLSRTGEAIESGLSVAREAGQPKAVALAKFDPARDMTVASEVNLVARIDPTQMLTVTGSESTGDGGVRTYVRRLFLLQDERDKRTAKTVRAAVLLPDEDVGRFLGLVGETGSKAKRGGQIVELNGISVSRPRLAKEAVAEIERQGMEPADDMVFVVPFLDGRATVFQPRDRSWRILVGFIAGAGAGLLVLAIGKRVALIKSAQS
ncbi:MAG: hypothetical protein DI533_21920 [Cereibacter sphaeroides]|uniref:Uncharacterized protein n=1 Tax=Cereibacter sphaeroides TaxID=1063 RepID=A0A2W5U9D9_CERSP|nr:MAG: hypothetical protein DI533_21920 [Cereibacter sphaeroides]